MSTTPCLRRIYVSPFLMIIVASLLFSIPVWGASMNDYCITPAFIRTPPLPNLLLMIDNSGSMYDLAWTDTTNLYCGNNTTVACRAGTTCSGAATCNASGVTTTTTSAAACLTDADCRTITPNDTCDNGKKNSSFTCKYSKTVTSDFTPTFCSKDADCQPPQSHGVAGDGCNNKCNVPHVCYDSSYASGTTYAGYFIAGESYSYDFSGDKFTGNATMPASCTYSAGSPRYLCVTSSGSPAAVATFVASGNFLNWLTTSKFDLEKKILTGGKFDPANNALVGESRGCSGRKFIKEAPGAALTFAIWGGTPGSIGSTQSQATEYGQSYIGIYAGTYDSGDCLTAMNYWLNINSVALGPFQNATKACVGAGNGTLNATSVWNHILHDCYQGMTGGAQGYSTNLNSLEIECKAIYASLLPSAIIDPNAAAGICSSVLTYQDSSGAAKTGYLGACYNSVSQTFNDSCAVTRMQDYCQVNVTSNPVMDPSFTALATSGQSAPGFIMELGLMNTTLMGTLKVQISATSPTGVINDYADKIAMGVMTFQNNGSGSECGGSSLIPCVKSCSATTTRICYAATDCPAGETCEPLARADGGKIISYIGAGNCSGATNQHCDNSSNCTSGEICVPSVGDHSSGLIKSIDDIQATTWTPYAEAFYNAMGYYARWNDPNYVAVPAPSRTNANFNQLLPSNSTVSYDANKNPSQMRCQPNNVLLITDGMSTTDQNSASEALATLYSAKIPYTVGGTTYSPGSAGYNSGNVHGFDTVNSCPPYAGSRSVSDLAWVAKNRNIKTLTTTAPPSSTMPQNASERISTYVVYSGPQISNQPGLCDPMSLMANTAANGGTTLFSAASPDELRAELNKAFAQVAIGSASGSAASILSNSEGTSALILQALFYPKKLFDNDTSVNWSGELHNLWYYLDPFISSSSIREDSDYTDSSGAADHTLNLKRDKIADFFFDTNTNQTMVNLSNGGTVTTDALKSIWKAGKLLWSRNGSDRKVYTQIDNTSLTLLDPTDAGGALTSYLDLASAERPTADDITASNKIITYLLGTDLDSSQRSRTVTIAGTSGVWKLGDIVSSTPRIMSTFPSNKYNLPPPLGYNDISYESFVSSREYTNRGMVYVGANDGMLHAFNLGKLTVAAVGDQRGKLSGTDMGKEKWAFIPKHALPYLKYLADPNYSHLYYVDTTPTVFDASIGAVKGCGSDGSYWDCPKYPVVVDKNNNLDAARNPWRSIIIGGMGLGGATRPKELDCTNVNCVTAPRGDPQPKSVPSDEITDLGYSSYFALDVTNPENPALLWEFSHPDLGFATSGPAIVRVSQPNADCTSVNRPNCGGKDLNGRWFAVFASGPTGPIDTVTHQFMGKSDKSLKLFIVDLASGKLARVMDTKIPNAFGGSLQGAAIDTDRWNKASTGFYQDDALYLGYVKEKNGKWNDGGVIRLLTRENSEPKEWTWSPVVDGIGPVTVAISRLQDRKKQNLWLYWGTGRFYFNSDRTADLDDCDSRRSIFAVKEPCYTASNAIDSSCSATIADTGIADQTTALHAVDKGWKINLEERTNNICSSNKCSITGTTCTLTDDCPNYCAERIVTNPVASTTGVVFYTSFAPTADICSFGGSSYLWAINFDSGSKPSASALFGKGIVQMSTGTFAEQNFTDNENPLFTEKLDRRSVNHMSGKPPADPPIIVNRSQNRPVKKILHTQEK